MKSAVKIPFKGKKTPYNLNEVDVNLLLKNPSHIRKVVKGNYKEENNYDEDESEEEEEGEDDKLEAHMKRYITEYFDNKYNKEKDQRKKVKQRTDVLDFISPFPKGKSSRMIGDEMDKYHEQQKLNPTKNFIRKKIDKLMNK
jgi:hypothetical protein